MLRDFTGSVVPAYTRRMPMPDRSVTKCVPRIEPCRVGVCAWTGPTGRVHA